jgi:hypothetical protein
VVIDDPKAPRVAAHLAILHERSANVRLEVNLNLLAAVRTGYEKLILQVVQQSVTGRSVEDGAGQMSRPCSETVDTH